MAVKPSKYMTALQTQWTTEVGRRLIASFPACRSQEIAKAEQEVEKPSTYDNKYRSETLNTDLQYPTLEGHEQIVAPSVSINNYCNVAYVFREELYLIFAFS